MSIRERFSLALCVIAGLAPGATASAAEGEAPAETEESAVKARAALRTAGLRTIEPYEFRGAIPKGAALEKGFGGKGASVRGPGILVWISERGKYEPKSLVDEKKRALETYSGTKLKAESTKDGWTLTFENTGSMGTNYFVKSQKTFGGVTYTCDTIAKDRATQSAALAFCKSLIAP